MTSLRSSRRVPDDSAELAHPREDEQEREEDEDREVPVRRHAKRRSESAAVAVAAYHAEGGEREEGEA